MKTLFIIMLTVFTTATFGQSNYIGINGGISLTNMTSENKHLYWPKYVPNFIGGISVTHAFKNRFIVSADILYNRFGFKDAYKITVGDNVNFKTSYSSFYHNYDYLSVPIAAGISMGNKYFCNIKLGLVPSFLVDAKTTFKGFDSNRNLTSSSTENTTSKTNRFDIGGIATISVGYKLSNKYAVVSDIAYHQSFTSIPNSNYYVNRQIQNYGFTLTLGLRYTLTKN